ncbi:MAG: hypothetical protein JWQ48_153 [Conexibacter sp.]|nr:hypothetical protein [Conexibacter sp.]
MERGRVEQQIGPRFGIKRIRAVQPVFDPIVRHLLPPTVSAGQRALDQWQGAADRDVPTIVDKGPEHLAHLRLTLREQGRSRQLLSERLEADGSRRIEIEDHGIHRSAPLVIASAMTCHASKLTGA